MIFIMDSHAVLPQVTNVTGLISMNSNFKSCHHLHLIMCFCSFSEVLGLLDLYTKHLSVTLTFSVI